MIKKEKLNNILRRGGISGREAGKLIAQDFVGMLLGDEPMLNDRDHIALRRSVRAGESGKVQEVCYFCMDLYEYYHDAEYFSWHAACHMNEMMTMLAVLTLCDKQGKVADGEWMKLFSLEIRIRLDLMVFFYNETMVDTLGELINLDCSPLLAPRITDLETTLAQYNLLITLGEALRVPDNPPLRALILEDFKPSEGWRDELLAGLNECGRACLSEIGLRPLYKHGALPPELSLEA